MDLELHRKKAQEEFSQNKKFIQKLKGKKLKNLDQIASNYHDEAFEEIDCLDCANCCKSISPIITDKDIQRISKHLRVKPSDFTTTYLNLDKDGDYVYKEQPCPFLGADNYCGIYEVRPKACAEYPHTDRKKFHQLLQLSLKNTLVCPAVKYVIDGIKTEFQ
jgi:Fe-S-cluster containining protein